MNKFVIVSVLIALFSVTMSAEVPVQQLGATVQIVDDIEKFKAENPELEWFPMVKEEVEDSLFSGERINLRYTAGNHVSGDRLVAQASNRYSYPSPQDVRLTLQYPVAGQAGALINFVDIIVEQSTNRGEAIIVSGGINQRQITIIVNAYGTTYFNYVAQIYGR